MIPVKIRRKTSIGFDDLIKKSRKIALQLGCRYISSIHFMLADCITHKVSSIKPLLFENDVLFEQFFASCLQDTPIEESDFSIPLTKELELVIHNAVRTCCLYADNEIMPWHVFASAVDVKKSLLSELLYKGGITQKMLVEHYNNTGEISIFSRRKLVNERYALMPLDWFFPITN